MPTTFPEKNRNDIQLLRGLAVLLVLLYHARLPGYPKAGYLGVDIFFVVSGYLITGMVKRDILSGEFSFTAFYLRRAKRLLPAAYVTFLLTTIASAWLLTLPEMKDFIKQLVGAVTFTGNVVLWRQTGYFEGAASLKPLLHVWSLSIEEQYYLLLPATMVLVSKRFWNAGAVGLTVTSLALCVGLLSMKPGAVFYLLPTRAWELGIGSLGSLMLEGSMAGATLGRVFWPAVGALLLVPFFPTGAAHPGADALIVCLATLVVILRKHPLLNDGGGLRPICWLGDISYSLYLVHWPMLALAANAWVSPTPGTVRLLLACSAVLVAWGMFRWVEQPIRQANVRFSGKIAVMAVGSSAALIFVAVLAFLVESSNSSRDWLAIRRSNVGLGQACIATDGFKDLAECQTSENPRMLVWGDSYAMHLVEGIRRSTTDGVVQATMATCGPFIGISMFREGEEYNRDWGRKCIRFNDDVIRYLKAHPNIDVVVLGSLYGQYLPGNKVLGRGTSIMSVGVEEREMDGSEDIAASALGRTVAELRRMGKKVVMVAPPPSAAGVDFGRCLERHEGKKAVMGAQFPTCEMSEETFRAAHQSVVALMKRVSIKENVPIFHFDQILCRNGKCAVEIDGVPIYRDNGHLSYEGSRLLGQRLRLADRLKTMAN